LLKKSIVTMYATGVAMQCPWSSIM